MGKYDEQHYFFRRESFNDKIPFLIPSKTTEASNYTGFEPLPQGGAPLVFYNSHKECNLKKRIQTEIGDVLFDGFNLIVKGRIREVLLDHDMPGLDMYPTIYVDDHDKWHEDYWYLAFTKRFTCWDKEKSKYDDTGLTMPDGEKIYDIDVKVYVLDEKLLDETPLEQRLLFKMGGTMTGLVTVHQKLVPLFSSADRKILNLKK